MAEPIVLDFSLRSTDQPSRSPSPNLKQRAFTAAEKGKGRAEMRELDPEALENENFGVGAIEPEAMDHPLEKNVWTFWCQNHEIEKLVVPLVEHGICFQDDIPDDPVLKESIIAQLEDKLKEVGQNSPTIKYLNLKVDNGKRELSIDSLALPGFSNLQLLRISQCVSFKTKFPALHLQHLEKFEVDCDGEIPAGFLEQLLKAAPSVTRLFLGCNSAGNQIKTCFSLVGSIKALYLASEFIDSLEEFPCLTYFDTTIEQCKGGISNELEMERILETLPKDSDITVIKIGFVNSIPSVENLIWLAESDRLTKMEKLVITYPIATAKSRLKLIDELLEWNDWNSIRPGVMLVIKEEGEESIYDDDMASDGEN